MLRRLYIQSDYWLSFAFSFLSSNLDLLIFVVSNKLPGVCISDLTATAMEAVLKDERFARIAKSKKFRNVSKKQRKVQIDERFKDMFKDAKFVSKCSVDKRGRPLSFTAKENFKKFYELKQSDDESDTTDSDVEEEEENLGVPVAAPVVDEEGPGELKQGQQSDETDSSSGEDSLDAGVRVRFTFPH